MQQMVCQFVQTEQHAAHAFNVRFDKNYCAVHDVGVSS
jgi:hypothetical protein